MADSRYPESEQVYRTFAELRNIFSFNLVRATYEHGFEVLRPNKRNFIISTRRLFGRAPLRLVYGLGIAHQAGNFLELTSPLF